VLLLADAYINKKKEAKAKKKKKKRNTGGCLLISCGLDIGKKKKIPRGCIFGADANSTTHEKKENDWEFRNRLVARTTSS
jgi:hypothetical protein